MGGESAAATELLATASNGVRPSPTLTGIDPAPAGRTWGSTAKVEDKAEQALARGIGARCDGDDRGAGCAIARLELEEGGEGEGEYGSSEGDKAGDDN